MERPDPMVEVSVEVSVVVPMLDAEDRISELYEQLAVVVEALGRSVELVFVDDGSSDGTWAEICRLASADPTVRGVRLAANAGQPAALCAGFSTCKGALVVMMDDDLETDPAELPRFVAAVEGGAEFASGWRQGTRPAWRSIGSQLFNRRLASWGVPFHDSGCGFDAMTAPVAADLADRAWDVRGHRFKLVVAELTDQLVEVRIPVRRTTDSHYSPWGLATAWLDVEMAFGKLTPARFLTAGTATPLAVAALLSLRSRRSRDPLVLRAGAALAGFSCVALASVSAYLLAARQRVERASRLGSAWEIAERTAATTAQTGTQE